MAPIGFQFRRVTEPLIKMQADKVYLVTFGENDEARSFIDQITKELSNYPHIVATIERVDLWDLYECLEKFREIIFKEKENHVFVNVSTGTKITAIAGMLASMLWKATPYYAPVSYPRISETQPPPTEIVDSPEILPVYDINRPKQESLLVLDLLKRAGGRMKKAQLIYELEKLGIIRIKDESVAKFTKSAKHSQLRVILDPMQSDWNYIGVESSGRRSEVSLTDQGATALRIFGTPKVEAMRRERPLQTDS